MPFHKKLNAISRNKKECGVNNIRFFIEIATYHRTFAHKLHCFNISRFEKILASISFSTSILLKYSYESNSVKFLTYKFGLFGLRSVRFRCSVGCFLPLWYHTHYFTIYLVLRKILIIQFIPIKYRTRAVLDKVNDIQLGEDAYWAKHFLGRTKEFLVKSILFNKIYRLMCGEN